MAKEDLEDILGAKVGPTAVFEEQHLHGQRFHQATCSCRQLNGKTQRNSWKARPEAQSRQLLQERASAACLAHHQHTVSASLLKWSQVLKSSSRPRGGRALLRRSSHAHLHLDFQNILCIHFFQAHRLSAPS